MSKILKRQGNPEERKKVHDNLAQISHLKSEFNSWKAKLKSREEDYEHEKAKLQRANDVLLHNRELLSAVEEEIDCDPLPEGAQPKSRLQKRDSLKMLIAQLEAAAAAQKSYTQSVLDSVNETERKVFLADRNLCQFVDNLKDTELAISVQEELDKERSQKLAKAEVRRAKRWEKEQKSAVDARSAQVQDLADIARGQVAVAQTQHAVAAHKVQADIQATKQMSRLLQEAHEEHLKHRTDAVIELKSNISSVRAELATQSDRHNSKVAAAKQQLEDEKDSLLSKGLNPYAEFRRKELNAEATALEHRLKKNVEHNKLELSARMSREEALAEKEALAQLEEHEHEKRFRDSQGRRVIEQKNQKYVTAITIGAKEILDPSGKASRVDPSQVTEIADNSFGLGKSSRIPKETAEKITEKIRTKLGVDKDNLGEYQRLVNGYLTAEDAEMQRTKRAGGKAVSFGGDRSASAPSETREEMEARKAQEKRITEFQSLGSVSGKMPGIGPSAATINLQGDAEKQLLLHIAEEEMGDSVKGALSVLKDKSPKYKIRPKSKFEEDSFTRALERQKSRIEEGTVQVAGGRVFQGQSFVSKPAELLFKDFEVGKKYKKVFTMTNASYTFNTFKLLSLTDDIIDFFTITYEKPGRMSAGVSCAIEIQFSPQISKEIFSRIKFQTETGPVEVPLTCLVKRCAPRIKNVFIDFGTVVMGQKVVQPMRVENTEALASSFFVERDVVSSGSRPVSAREQGDGAESLDAPAAVAAAAGEQTVEITEDFDVGAGSGQDPALNEAELNARVQRVLTEVFRKKKKDDPFPLSFKEREGFVCGYDKTTMDVVCAPLAVGEVIQTFTVAFDGVNGHDGTVDADGNLITREQTVTLKVRGEEVPIYLEDIYVDMKSTLFGRIYRKRLEVRNRGSISYRVNINIPSPYNKFIEVNPAMVFVQSQSSQAINIKFAPTPDILSQVGYFSVPVEGFSDAALMKIPVLLQVINQELPVHFVLRSIVCPSTLVMSASNLDFGQIYVNQQSTIRLNVKNISLQSQKVSFVRLPKEISVQPNDGFAALLPNEDINFEVSFCPLSAIGYDLRLQLQSSLNDLYTLNVEGQGVDCPVSLNFTAIQLRTTCPGERVLDSIIATNTTKKTQCFEIVCPDSRFSWLKVSPSVVELQPGQGARLEIEYLPPRDVMSLDPYEWNKSVEALVASSTESASPFTEWIEDCGWVRGKGFLGEIHWVKAGAGSRAPVVVPVDGENEEGQEENNAPAPEESDLPEDIAANEWGIFGQWRLPLFVRRGRAGTASTARSSDKTTFPLFIDVKTTVTVPQLEVDTNFLDFGQIALGTRQLKVLKIRNLSSESISLRPTGLSAVGPFTVLNYIRTMQPGEFRNVVIECYPVRPGLSIEVLELIPAVQAGGHCLRITIRAESMKPAVSLEGLSPPPPSWNPRCGLLNFNNILAGDVAVQKFSVSNKSQFPVDINITRVSCVGLSPLHQAPLMERTSGGLPIFTYRPERFNVVPGASQQIEVFFRPDRGRFFPFREDLNVRVGDTDEVLTVGIFGRSWTRQIFVIPANPADEPFYKTQELVPSAFVEDMLTSSMVASVRSAAEDSRTSLYVRAPPAPTITLEYPDPYAEGVDPSTYVVNDGNAPAGGGGGKGAKVPVNTMIGRLQTRKLLICSVKILDTRPSTNGTFEVVLSPLARECGMFTVSVDKGAVNAGTEVPVEISCTLPKPKGIGGLAVGSWKNYEVEVVIKGGWISPGESDEVRIPLILKAFVSL